MPQITPSKKRVMMLRVVGIDLAGAEGRDTGFCILKDLKAESHTLHRDGEIVSKILEANPRVVAIDAPLALPSGRCCLEDDCSCRGKGHFRKCDLELRRMGIPFFPVTLGPMRKLTRRGIVLRKILEETGFEVIETYPGGAQDLWGIPRRRDLEGLRRGLKGLGVTGSIDKTNISNHELDAITCALVGRLYALGDYVALGDAKEVLMILPRKG